MTFGKGFVFAHKEAAAFILACPLIALIPLLAEFLQHAIEVHIGMYDGGPENAQAVENHPLRMQFGFVKVLALSVIAYPVIRFVAGGRDKRAAATLERRAVALFAGVLAFGMALAAFDLFAARQSPTLPLWTMLASLLLMPLLYRWMTSASLGHWVSPARSAREMLPAWMWAASFSFVVMLPLMVLHYAMNIGAIFAPDWATWPLLIADSFVVTLLAVVLITGQWVAANRPEPVLGSARPA